MTYQTMNKNDIDQQLSMNPEMFFLMKKHLVDNNVFLNIEQYQDIHTFGLNSCNGICDQDMEYVGKLKNLRQLYFCNVPFTGQCLKYFENTNSLTKLYFIFLQTTSITALSYFSCLKFPWN